MSTPRKKTRGRKKQKRHGGQFRKGHDPRRHSFTREECQRGFQAACAKSWEIASWLHKKLQLYYAEDRKRAKAQARQEGWTRSIDDSDVRDAARNGTGHERNGDAGSAAPDDRHDDCRVPDGDEPPF